MGVQIKLHRKGQSGLDLQETLHMGLGVRVCARVCVGVCVCVCDVNRYIQRSKGEEQK